MTQIEQGIYFGTVTHRRLRPAVHSLSYDVASLLVDVDLLPSNGLPGLFSYNRFNLFSIHDRDHGQMNNQSISDFAWSVVRQTPGTGDVTQIYMLCYPRVLGYGFNPMTAYYAVTAAGETRLMIYEVHNTFGGRHTYVSGAFEAGQLNYSHAEKVFRVSPFNGIEGQYGLRATNPLETLTLGVSLTTAEGPLLKAYFTGRRRPLTHVQLLRMFFGLPLMTLKVFGAIHWEALKLWRKGIKLESP